MADLLYAAVLEKLSGNSFTEDFDFDGIVPEGITVSSVANSVFNAAGTTTTGVVTASSLSSPVATLTINTGSSEQSYLIKCVATGSNSKTYTLTKLMNVSLPGVYR